MSKSNYLDIKTIKKYARELRKVVMELDGSIHNETEEYDQFRDEVMKLMGLHVMRLKNEELSDMNLTIEKIILYLNTID